MCVLCWAVYPDAQCRLGAIYFSGHGLQQDDAQSAVWYRKAAEQGQAQAQFELGWMYSCCDYDDEPGDPNQFGLPHDMVEATRWWRAAAEQGHAPAQAVLGASYSEGRGVPKDFAQAALWLRKAAEQGDALAQCELGDLYAHGRGVPQDYAKAAAWYHKAAEQGNADAMAALDAMAQSPITFEMGETVPLKNPKPHATPSVAQEEDEIDLSAGFRPLSMTTAIELHPDDIENLPLPVSSSAQIYSELSDSLQEETTQASKSRESAGRCFSIGQYSIDTAIDELQDLTPLSPEEIVALNPGTRFDGEELWHSPDAQFVGLQWNTILATVNRAIYKI